MKQVRFGIIGVGGMGSGHARTMQNIEECKLTAVCDMDEEVVKSVAEQYGVKSFTDYRELIDSGLVDAVIVATPHYFHPPISVYAMKKGIAVLSEKPIAVTVKGADEMVRTAEETGVPFAVMYQTRSTGFAQAAKKLVDEGRLGEIYRASMIVTYFRSQAYYNSAGWRATWRGEGGGVLINQAPHALDLFTWLGGLPSKVSAVTRTRRHQIEVEDEASAMLEYPNGAIGYLHTSTNEAPGTNFMEFCGEKGKLVLYNNRIYFWELETPVQVFSDTTDQMWGSPKAKQVEVPIEERESGHGAIMRNLARNILYGEELISPGAEGLNSVELINAVILSGARRKEVTIPVDRDEYEEFIEGMKAKSKEKKVVKARRETDPQHLR
ncbi:Gfo/Idh/MocA family oxidoreductase [Candidatus Poribacteria bacterium]|nr:Gfo/Idh/MocA family oxidoreductase [Candidatus Poribacteria bacterium]